MRALAQHRGQLLLGEAAASAHPCGPVADVIGFPLLQLLQLQQPLDGGVLTGQGPFLRQQNLALLHLLASSTSSLVSRSTRPMSCR